MGRTKRNGGSILIMFIVLTYLPLGMFKTGYQIDPNPEIRIPGFSDSENHYLVPVGKNGIPIIQISDFKPDQIPDIRFSIFKIFLSFFKNFTFFST